MIRGPAGAPVALTVNDETYLVELEPRVSLLDALRDHLDLTGSKKGCDQGTCGACHGLDGKGNQAVGAPNLTDEIWLHGWGEQAIVAMVNNGKLNEMPAQAGKLTEAQIHVLAAYVWGLSNKHPPAKP